MSMVGGSVDGLSGVDGWCASRTCKAVRDQTVQSQTDSVYTIPGMKTQCQVSSDLAYI